MINSAIKFIIVVSATIASQIALAGETRIRVSGFEAQQPSKFDEKILKLIWDYDTPKIPNLPTLDYKERMGKRGEVPEQWIGVWVRDGMVFPKEYERFKGLFITAKRDGNISNATSMRRVAPIPRTANTEMEYVGYHANGGGRNGKPTGLLHAFKAKGTEDFLVLQELDLQIMEGNFTMSREMINATVNSRPAHLFFDRQAVGGIMHLMWPYDGFYRIVVFYCAEAKRCENRDWLLKVASEWK